MQKALLSKVLIAKELLEHMNDGFNLRELFDKFLVMGAALQRVPGDNKVSHAIKDSECSK
jgi:hypothetical protein